MERSKYIIKLHIFMMSERNPRELSADEAQEQFAPEIEAELSKPFDKREGLKEVDRYYIEKREEIDNAIVKVAKMFPRRKTTQGMSMQEAMNAYNENVADLAMDISKYSQYQASDSDMSSYAELDKKRIESLPEYRFIAAIVQTKKRLEKNRAASNDVLNRREANELKKKEDALMAEIQKI